MSNQPKRSLVTVESLRADIESITRSIDRVRYQGDRFVHRLDPTMTGEATIEALSRIREVKRGVLDRLLLRK